MSFEKTKEPICQQAALKWKRFLRATEEPTVRTSADLSVRLCAEDGGVDLIGGSVDGEIPLRDLAATVAAIALLASLSHALFGKR